MTKGNGETFSAFTAAKRSAALLHELDEGHAALKANADDNADDMQHAPHCQRLVIIRTAGYSVTVERCDECGAVTTTRHGGA